MTLLLLMSLVTQVYSDTTISIPIIYSDHPGNHSLLTGDNITLQCQISNWNKDDKYSVSWFRYLLNTSSILLNIFEMNKGRVKKKPSLVQPLDIWFIFFLRLP